MNIIELHAEKRGTHYNMNSFLRMTEGNCLLDSGTNFTKVIPQGNWDFLDFVQISPADFY